MIVAHFHNEHAHHPNKKFLIFCVDVYMQFELITHGLLLIWVINISILVDVNPSPMYFHFKCLLS